MKCSTFPLVVLAFIGSSAHLNAQAEKDKAPLTFQQRFSKGIGDAVFKRLAEFYKKHGIEDPIEKHLIESIDRFIPREDNSYESTSFTLFKPGKQPGLLRTVTLTNENNAIQLHYTCLAARIDTPMAVITCARIQNNEIHAIDRFLFYSEKQCKWELAPLKGSVGLGTTNASPEEPRNSRPLTKAQESRAPKDELTVGEEKRIRDAIYGDGLEFATIWHKGLPQRVFVVPEGVKSVFSNKPKGTVRLLLKIVEGACPQDAIHAGTCVEALVHSPARAVITGSLITAASTFDNVPDGRTMTEREQMRRQCVNILEEFEKNKANKTP